MRTGCCGSIADHPLPKYLEHGLLVTLNTDDPEMFETTLNGEYALAQSTFGLSDSELGQLSEMSLRAAFRQVG